MSKTTYHGSCFCGANRFTVDIDFAATPTGRCNCRSCRKRRWWAAQVGLDDFHLETDEGRSRAIATGGGMTLHVCPDCGVLLYGATGKQEWNDGPRVSVSVAVLDDLSPETLLAAPMTFYDGLHDNWWNPPAEVRHL